MQPAADAQARAQRPSFNPHPSRRTGATLLPTRLTSSRCWFQSSPVPEDGCNLYPDSIAITHQFDVSILTRPGGRVQPMIPALDGG